MHEQIRALREDHDLTQSQIARQLSIAQTTYSDYERGKLNIPIPILIKLAEIFQTSVDYLLGLTEIKEPYPRRRG